MTERGQAIVLIGFMGTGKSSVGRALARRIKCSRFDTDEMVAARFDLPVPEIFAQFGEEKFRDTETEALRELSGASRSIVVTGGGIVVRPENMKLLHALGIVVNLQADEETLFRRVSRRTTRPLLQTENPRATLRKMLRERETLYCNAADMNLDTSQLTSDEVAEAVLKRIESW